jgi:hypothetical protein
MRMSRLQIGNRPALVTGGARWLFLLAGLAGLWWAGAGRARVEADPGKDYVVTPAEGPWLIIVTYYTGPLAQKYARDLVLELRDRYDLPAFVFNRGADERQKFHDAQEKRRQQRQQFLDQMGVKVDVPERRRTYRIEDQYAVLVGGYKDMEAARRALDHVKKLDAPKTVPLDTMQIAGPDAADKDKKKMKIEEVRVNPFRTSFVVHNPTVPVERPKEQPDPLLKELNAGESYSLLKAAKPWTLMVKDYHRATVIQDAGRSNFLGKLVGRHDADLDAMAKQAHEIAKVLRAMQLESYVLHTRWGSVVTVGNYSTANDPALVQMQRRLANFRLVPQAGPPIEFFAVPVPMEVPRP